MYSHAADDAITCDIVTGNMDFNRIRYRHAIGRAGFTRATPELRDMSQQPRGAIPVALRFRARALVGLGPRAEVLVYLWTHTRAHGRLIATRAAYGQTAVAEYLAALEHAGLARRREEGRKVEYMLEETLRGIADPPPAYVDWVRAWPLRDRDVCRRSCMRSPAGSTSRHRPEAQSLRPVRVKSGVSALR